MSRNFLGRMTSRSAVCTALGLGIALPLGAWAQNQSGGMLMELRLAERFITRQTSGPDTAGDGVTNQLVTDMDFALSSETRTEAVTLDFGAGYRFFEGPTTDGFEGEFTDPSLKLSYKQTASSASLSVTATATQVNLDDVSALTLSADDGLVQDFADLEDGGTRTQLSFNGRLSVRDDAPFGLIFTLYANDISYQDLPSDSTLAESSTGRFSTTGRFDISEVLQARVGLSYTATETDGEDRADRYGITTQAILTRPSGDITLSGSFADGDGDAQTTVQLGRSFVLPQTEADFAMGLTQLDNDAVYVTGAASIAHDFGDDSRLGTLTASADRSVSLDTSNDEQIVTSLALASSYAVSPQATVRLGANLAQSEDVSSGDTVDLAQTSLSLGYTFDRNWQGSASLAANLRDPSYEAASESATLSLGLTRTFDVRR